MAAGRVSLQTGHTFHGLYEVAEQIGSGGMGAVFRVRHTRTERELALKVMLRSTLDDASMRERFGQEATITSHIRSEHLVQIVDAGVDPQTQLPFIVMELLEGKSLRALIARQGRLSFGEMLEVVRQTARLLAKTHASGIVHRDLKPANLFVVPRDDGSRCVKVMDFGIAKIVAGAGADTTAALGTPL